MTDDYSAREAAKIIGRSERLVRKLAKDGRLKVTQEQPLRLSQESVHAERNKRKPVANKGKIDSQTFAITAEQLEQIIERAVAAALSETLPRMIEAADKSQQLLEESLAQSRAEAEQLRQQLDDERSGLSIKLPPFGWPFRH